MVRIGISSSALLRKKPAEIVALAKDLGFDGIEWAGDPHCGEGDLATAAEVMMATLRAGLTIASYAPVYRVTSGGGSGIGFPSILATAAAINAPFIRVYAGVAPLPIGAARAALLDELRSLGDEAGRKGIGLVLSPGARTCMETWTEALSLCDEVSHPFVGLAWEPLAEEKNGEGLEALVDDPRTFRLLRARRVHRSGRSRPLSEETAYWTRVFEAFEAKPGEPSIGSFALLGGIGDSSEGSIKALGVDLDFARSVLGRAKAKG
jgi:hypothetical protein